MSDPDRQHRLGGRPAARILGGLELPQWEYEVTAGGRARYLVDEPGRTVHLVYASPRHPKDTDSWPNSEPVARPSAAARPGALRRSAGAPCFHGCVPLYVGTSGWQYDDWRGVLYEPGTPRRLWLEEYAQRFATVENNNAFYRLPTAETFAAWRERTPEGFVMAVKASRFLTHIKRLRDPQEPVRRLMSAAAGLGSRLGPVLLQLPPTLRADVDALDSCLRCFPSGVRVAVEPRHESWWVPEVRAVLERRGAALCWADRQARPVTPLWRTADWGYLRFHAGLAQPPPRYGRRSLATWMARVDEAWPDEADVYAYFNNDPGGAAPLDAVAFARAAAKADRTVSRADIPERR